MVVPFAGEVTVTRRAA